MKISVVGTGYVGLVSGTCFADSGITVTCVDIDEKKIEGLKNGIIPIYEPGLETKVKDNVDKNRLSFTTEIKESLVDCEAVFIAVGTPPDEDGSADLSYVLGVARDIGKHMTDYLVVVTKSTVPIGTAKKVRAAVKEELEKRQVNIEFDVASNPEFLKEGDAIKDFLKPDRIVVGTDSERAMKVMQRLYKPFTLNGHPIIFMDIPSAELTKYAANSMLATRISFMNEIANLCEIVGADINHVRKGIGSDTRIGNKFLYAGVGYGGSCFPKDVKALIKTADENKYSLEILKSVEKVNDKQKSVLFEKLMKYFNGNLEGKTITLWGLSFKPNTDDMREAPALVIIEKLLKEKAIIKTHDPVAMHETKRRIGDTVAYCKDIYEALIDADALLILTEWSEFRVPNYVVMSKLMKNKVIFDGRNIYDPTEIKEQGFEYFGIGRS
ncbi:MAG: UDP-glucose 6-dehydrogenase [Bacteroidetes bacterium RIFOXYA12_FULL_35_11]|nr:MAG: UDP-glucose 6-dehydrogenase [Bacteroidetes bacterium GWF2_35_48]OFY75095.1 MAG: UDP-glucose 6-dehydrogenase [Bacteroidetes bacterium RIFOXYA12_FULL_35_11]OFY99669.1 MAG: UDP-glucose 6-dehydrogenase [Bacteroidetes bacterium RIFOXYC12_FULL_35_7]HBX52128.1 UDP-glucose 6-dehydrogenase [Bacteroidales bacterium]